MTICEQYFTEEPKHSKEQGEDPGPEAAAAGVAAGVALGARPALLATFLALLHRQHRGVQTLAGLVQILLALHARHGALVVPLLVVDVHHHVVVVRVVEVLLLLSK